MKLGEYLLHLLSLTGFVSAVNAVNTKEPGRLRLTNHSGNIIFPDVDVLSISEMLNEVLLGPLEGHKVTLILFKDPETEKYSSDDIIRGIETPVSLLRLPRFIPQKEEDLEEEIDNTKGMFLEKSVIVLLLSLEDEILWSLWFQQSALSTDTVLIVCGSPSCWRRPILETPLIEQAPSVAMIGPDTQSRPSSQGPRMIYVVKTWLPFTSQEKLTDLGPWNPSSFISWHDLFVDRFQDMSDKTMLLLANTFDHPFVFPTIDGSPTGQNIKILESFSKWLRFKLEYDVGDSVNWTSITNSVREGRTEVMVNFASATPERNIDYHISTPVGFAGFSLILKIPPPLPLWRNVIYPFTWEVWTSVGASFLLVSIAFHRLNHEHEESFATNAVTIAKSLSRAPLSSIPKGWGIRSFLIVWWIGAWILTVSYACNLIAILTVPVFPSKIRTHQELAKSNLRLCMLDYGEFVPEALATSDHSTLNRLGTKMDLVPIITHLPDQGQEACMEHVLEGTHAQTESHPFVEIMYSRNGYSNQIYSLKELLYPSHLIFLIHKRSPWKYKFDDGIDRLRETGIVQKLYLETLAESLETTTQKSPSSMNQKPLTMSYLQGPFFLLLLGLCVAISVFSAEVLLLSTSKHGFKETSVRDIR